MKWKERCERRGREGRKDIFLPPPPPPLPADFPPPLRPPPPCPVPMEEQVWRGTRTVGGGGGGGRFGQGRQGKIPPEEEREERGGEWGSDWNFGVSGPKMCNSQRRRVVARKEIAYFEHLLTQCILFLWALRRRGVK